MGDLALRSALGLESSKWDSAGEFAIPLRKIDMLAYMSDRNRTLRWVAQQVYSMLFRSLGESMVDNKRRCAWYFGSDLPARNHQIPYNFDMIRIIPQSHYICFYDASSTKIKHKYIAKLDILKPKDRQRLFDIRYAQPNVRQRLLKWNRKIRSGKESLLRQTLEKTLPVTGTNGEPDGNTQDIKTGKTGIVHDGDNQGSGCLVNTPSNSVLENSKDLKTTVDEDM